mmetsp:Transcript_91039/g.262447  ORF Transcript_91039/g.262447 Transcript_91039/m.262447 type:complete len:394 (+) Transcript_91039:827-2008(+)
MQLEALVRPQGVVVVLSRPLPLEALPQMHVDVAEIGHQPCDAPQPRGSLLLCVAVSAQVGEGDAAEGLNEGPDAEEAPEPAGKRRFRVVEHDLHRQVHGGAPGGLHQHLALKAVLVEGLAGQPHAATKLGLMPAVCEDRELQRVPALVATEVALVPPRGLHAVVGHLRVQGLAGLANDAARAEGVDLLRKLVCVASIDPRQAARALDEDAQRSPHVGHQLRQLHDAEPRKVGRPRGHELGQGQHPWAVGVVRPRPHCLLRSWPRWPRHWRRRRSLRHPSPRHAWRAVLAGTVREAPRRLVDMLHGVRRGDRRGELEVDAELEQPRIAQVAVVVGVASVQPLEDLPVLADDVQNLGLHDHRPDHVVSRDLLSLYLLLGRDGEAGLGARVGGVVR